VVYGSVNVTDGTVISPGFTLKIVGNFTVQNGTTLSFGAVKPVPGSRNLTSGVVVVQGIVKASGKLEVIIPVLTNGDYNIILMIFDGIVGDFQLTTTIDPGYKRQTACQQTITTPVKTAKSYGANISVIPCASSATSRTASGSATTPMTSEPVVAPSSGPVLSGGAIAGIFIGGVAAIVIVALVIFFVVKKTNSKHLDLEKDAHNKIEMKEKKPVAVAIKPADTSSDEGDTSSNEDTSSDDQTSQTGKTSETGQTSKTSSSSSGSDSDSDSDSDSKSSSSGK